jgi:hypothetical protein
MEWWRNRQNYDASRGCARLHELRKIMEKVRNRQNKMNNSKRQFMQFMQVDHDNIPVTPANPLPIISTGTRPFESAASANARMDIPVFSINAARRSLLQL